MNFKIGNGKIVKETEKVEEKKEDPFNQLLNETTLNAVKEVKEEKLNEINEKEESAMFPSILESSSKVTNEEEKLEFEKYKMQQAQMQQAQMQQAQMQQVPIDIFLIENNKISVLMEVNDLNNFLNELDTAIAESTTFRIDDIVINCRNVKYYTIDKN